MKQLVAGFIALLWPAPCVCCGGESCGARALCDECWALLEVRDGARCPQCDRMHPSPDFGMTRCGRCITTPPAFDGATALYDYAGPAGDAIRAAKYGGRIDGLIAVVRRVDMDLPDGLRDDRPDAVLPVPSHSRRRRERRIDAPMVIGRRVATNLAVPYRSSWLHRERHTVPQAGLGDGARRRNVRRAFRASPRVRGLDILVVDDVVTTGATADAAARALRTAGARRVRLFAAARVECEG